MYLAMAFGLVRSFLFSNSRTIDLEDEVEGATSIALLLAAAAMQAFTASGSL